MHILVVEDDSVLGDAVTRSLRECGYAVDWLTSGAEADRALTHDDYDLVVLDLGLPQLDGLDVLRRLRNRKSRVPVLVLTARQSVHDRIHGLDIGADDYLTKPFKIGELRARIRALIRRTHGLVENQIEVGRLVVDVRGRRALLDGVAMELSARELALLEVLAARAGHVVSKDALLRSLYSWDNDIGPNAIEIHIHRIRKKLRDSGISIRTVRGLGYLIEPDVATSGSPQDDA